MCKILLRSTYVACSCMSLLIRALMIIFISITTCHVYLNMKGPSYHSDSSTSSMRAQYFEGPVKFSSVLTLIEDQTCKETLIRWGNITHPFAQVDGILTWQHEYPLTAVLKIPPNTKDVHMRSKTFTKRCIQPSSIDATPIHSLCEIRLSQFDSLSIITTKNVWDVWELWMLA